MKNYKVIIIALISFAMGALMFNSSIVIKSPMQSLNELSLESGVEIYGDTLNVFLLKPTLNNEDVRNLNVLEKHFVIRIHD